MKRKIEFGCLFILSVCLACMICAWLFAQECVQMHNQTYDVEFRTDLGIPQKVDWVITDSCLGKVKRSPSFKFKADGRTPRPRITSALYTRSGYQRGHMCPAADRSSSKSAMRETFMMTNVAPMTPTINVGAWRATEDACRAYARNGRRVHVSAGPLFFPQDTIWIGKGLIAVPHAYMKFLWCDGEPAVFRYWIIENKF